MDNPPITSWKLLDVGNSFVYKGNYCTVTKIKYNGFHYDIQNSSVKGYMTFKHYTTIPSYKAKQRKFGTNKKLMYICKNKTLTICLKLS